MGQLNTRTLLRRLRELGLASRAELAKSLGMSQPTAGRIVDELLQLGVLEEIATQGTLEASGTPGNGTARLGRPGRQLRLNEDQPRFLAIQLAVEQTSFTPLPVGFNGEDRWAWQIDTPASEQELVEQFQRIAAQLPAHEYWGVLVSVPGIVDEPKGRVLYSPNLHWTERLEIIPVIQKFWPVPVILVQEERALALGQQATDPGGQDFLLVDFGEGVGGAVILEGKLCANPLPISGELGHTPVLGNGRPCGCGATGCLETLGSTRGLLQSLAEHQPVGAVISWEALAKDIAVGGVPAWLAETLEAAAVVIAGALNVLGLRRVVITGRLGELPPAVMEHLSAAVSRGALWARFGRVECDHASRRRLAGLVAAGIDRLVSSVAVTPHGY